MYTKHHAKQSRKATTESPTMYASIFKAHRAAAATWELVIHSRPDLQGNSITDTYYFESKTDAKKAAKTLGAQAYNY